MTANKPYWWQRCIPRYGNWGGVGWSAGCWNNDPALTDWTVNPVDVMDALFKAHDCCYQAGLSRMDGDYALITALRRLEAKGLWPLLYRAGAILLFYLHIGWLLFRGESE